MRVSPVPKSFTLCQSAKDNDCIPVPPDGQRPQASKGSLRITASSPTTLDIFDCIRSRDNCWTERSSHATAIDWPSATFPGSSRAQTNNDAFMEVKQLQLQQLTSFTHQHSFDRDLIGFDSDAKPLRGEIWQRNVDSSVTDVPTDEEVDKHIYLYDVQAQDRAFTANAALLAFDPIVLDDDQGWLNCPAGTGFFAPANAGALACSSSNPYPPGLTFRLKVSVTGPAMLTAPGISCIAASAIGTGAGDCDEDYSAGTEVTIQARRRTDKATRVGWGGVCASATGDTCVVRVDRDRSASVEYKD